MQEIYCHVDDISLMGRDVYRVSLMAEKTPEPPYLAGQYLTLQVEGGRWIPFSIGNAPEQTSHIELHIRLLPGHTLAEHILSQLRKTRRAHIQIPLGQCVLRSGERPVVAIVGGTGFSPIKAMFESAFAQKDPRHFNLYWGAQTETDFYLKTLPEQWLKEHPNFSFVPVISGEDPSWSGERGLVHQVALSKLDALTAYDYYISGSEAMVMAVYADLLAAGVGKERIFADMLDIKREMGESI